MDDDIEGALKAHRDVIRELASLVDKQSPGVWDRWMAILTQERAGEALTDERIRPTRAELARRKERDAFLS